MTYYYISTTGDDNENGLSLETAIATIAHAYQIMSPGDTLYFADGIYTQQLYPPVSLSGSAEAYTGFIAINPGKVTLAPVGYNLSESALYVYSSIPRGVCHHMEFVGFYIVGSGESYACRLNSQDNLAENQLTHDIIMRRIGVFGSAKDINATAFELSNVKSCLIEDSYAYGFGRKSFEVFGCRSVTIRRLVTRFDWWEGDSYIPTDPRNCFTVYNSQDSIFENIIAFNAGPNPANLNQSAIDRSGVTASGNLTDVNPISGTRNCKFAGILVINNNPVTGIHNGVMINGGSGENTTDLEFVDVAVFNQKSFGFVVLNNATNISFDYCTSGRNNASGMYVAESGSISGISVDHSYFHDNASRAIYQGVPMTITNTTYDNNPNSADLELAYAPTILYPPQIQYVVGHERGADLSKKYVNGVKTSENLWPWPYENDIKDHMCNIDDLDIIGAAISSKNGAMTYRPDWAVSGKSLTEYIFELFANSIPEDIYGTAPITDIVTLSQIVSTNNITVSYTITPGDNPIQTISWLSDKGSSGTLTQYSGVFIVPLVVGDNIITLTAFDGGIFVSDSITVTYIPSVPPSKNLLGGNLKNSKLK